ncbi:MAG: hypothetical protein UU73_C0003G0285 [Candidatus Daviesbacteria bacterium GW2011_GWA1_41_61]|uniref:Uncharacterized protein n=1 Tax=Candidatus Daviesbacteria bacterium GW2011_GWA2_40_9 TaxID=1618424 RepID=A0A0G0U0K9_9BACT|nr:MAG: hypothetical protein UU29_C0010G0025 [Candidatus Daviesbacteria bacterium GW2011_GWA2_40_9]KKR93365.1 MAG: hypothetical protein UU44_C0002G0026 [Candidatus Daviesbacteria bacterium GW2011_GWB1_41_15]KKS15086.1 MAG: hypothetical protein UU73_C0003G0285 [Candidatus Daviesbacteria bacterium GW2011_GWA1_41_61]
MDTNQDPQGQTPVADPTQTADPGAVADSTTPVVPANDSAVNTPTSGDESGEALPTAAVGGDTAGDTAPNEEQAPAQMPSDAPEA